MKIVKACLVVLVVGFVMGSFSLGTGHAQDMSIWIGKWFKVTSQLTGYTIDPEDPSRMTKSSSTETTYMKVRSWADKILLLDAYDYDEEEGIWLVDEVPVHYFGGTNLNFACYIIDTPQEPGEVPDGMTLQIVGKMKGEELKSATLTSLGAYYVDEDEIGAVKVTGKLIPESQVPPEIR